MSELPILPSGEELAEERKNVFLPEDDWQDIDISNDWLNPEDEWETAKNAMYIGDAPVCSLGGLTILTGQSGNGKTMTIAMLASAVFRGEYGQFKLGSDIERPTVLYVDTEMEKYNTQRLMNRVYYINNWAFKTQHPEFRILRLRETVDVATRWKKVLKAIDETKPTFCILDGLLDLVNDFNNNVECQNLVYRLMAAASHYDMSVVGVIHQNPGGDKMAGHLGSFGERKAITTLATKKVKNGNDVLFVVEQKKARDKDADDFKFRVNNDSLHIGIPKPVEGVETSKDTFTTEQLRQWMTEANKTEITSPFTLQDLKTLIRGILGTTNNDALQHIMEEAKKHQMIVPQPKAEMVKGSKFPRWYFNEDNLNIAPF